MEHSKTQGQRVHFLANLGGLVVLSGLDQLNPEILLGILLNAKVHFDNATSLQRNSHEARGRALLEQRGREKRAWRSFQSMKRLHQFYLSKSELETIVSLLKKVGIDGALQEKLTQELRSAK